jgi:hypothetical protein
MGSASPAPAGPNCVGFVRHFMLRVLSCRFSLRDHRASVVHFMGNQPSIGGANALANVSVQGPRLVFRVNAHSRCTLLSAL